MRGSTTMGIPRIDIVLTWDKYLPLLAMTLKITDSKSSGYLLIEKKAYPYYYLELYESSK